MIKQRLKALRDTMRQHQLHALIIPTADPHLSEYIPDRWQTRQYFSGFTGSAGVLIVQPETAQLWTDFRYWTQAAAELSGSNIELRKQEKGQNYLADLVATLPENARVGMAADMLSLAEYQRIQAAFAPKNIILWHECDLAAEIWGDARPVLPNAPVFAQKAEFVPQSAAEKLARVREKMCDLGADYHLVSALDDIAWLTNLRGSDIEFNPVFLAHLLIGADDAVLFIAPEKINAEIQAALNAANIKLQDYANVADYLTQLSGCLLLDPAKIALATVAPIYNHAKNDSGSLKILEADNPSSQFKAQKSPAEIAHIRAAMLQDGIALCGFFAELEQKLARGDVFNEYDISDLLLQHRCQREHFVSESFSTIAGFNENGAMPHYRAPVSGSLNISGNGLLLIDSGGQYHMGTTDITRVVPIGTPSAAQVRDFTLVLKAHIALATAVFPEGISSGQIDAICRLPLWQAQCDYGHGTGHGVGYFLNVHEPPQRISYHAPNTPFYAMREGMLTSNEPGLYRPNQWGIRIENLVVNQKVAQPQESEFGEYLHFETVTLCPIDTRLVDVAMLREDERAWLNAYHQNVREKLLPFVAGAAKDWLLKRTEAI
ncbi:aminopeptidase P family protein [Wielerella bovis]|uniref:aminopeptidase P family protein n=1 Tax=Wielerella bovis TaxID=2917790 RepID=UPI002019FDAE|nr:aminopeptidase P family protein [Wielerella bovis]ULJ64765.1 aminopeptidase P family protein [Wielerella bovis]ULJ67037.1 aminopeptidase P family protein [Wielerella bovis]